MPKPPEMAAGSCTVRPPTVTQKPGDNDARKKDDLFHSAHAEIISGFDNGMQSSLPRLMPILIKANELRTVWFVFITEAITLVF